jgi:predicted DNA-binding antitoxin AbrB/MazE fold protein
MFSFGYFPGIRLSFADVSEPYVRSIFKGLMKPLKMDLTEGSETSTKLNTQKKIYKSIFVHCRFQSESRVRIATYPAATRGSLVGSKSGRAVSCLFVLVSRLIKRRSVFLLPIASALLCF